MNEIVSKIKDGDSHSFEAVIVMFQQRIFKLCYCMLGNRQEAEDAVQETFFKAFNNLEKFNIESSFNAWIYKIAVNYCNTLNKRKQKKTFIYNLFNLPNKQKSAEDEYLDKNINSLLLGLTYL